MLAPGMGDLAEVDFRPDLPFGLLRCTCEKHPRVLWASEQMLRFLGTTRDSEDWRDMFREDVFFMIPFEERRAFREYLELAGQSAEPVCIEHRVVNCAGGYTSLLGWLRAALSPLGEREYHFSYIQAPQNYGPLRQHREDAYRRALKDVYDFIYEVDRTQGVVECIHRKDDAFFLDLNTARVLVDSIRHQDIFDSVYEEDRAELLDFLRGALRREKDADAEPLTYVRFRVVKNGEVRNYLGAAIELDERSILLCGRDITGDREVSGQKDAPAVMPRPRVLIRTFGHFDVFVDGKPVMFRHEKSKEMLAVLVDRYGGFVSNPYVISCLWEDEIYGEKVQGRCRQTAYRMTQTLKEYGIEDIVERVDGRRRIVPELVECDYFDYLQGSSAGQRFNGIYMSDYSWGEFTLSSLGKDEEI